ncbi:MAG: biotin transporter BioY [Peptostreptococcaceae bacterium]|nr:biotin transporter BioY [Peptostreptococcaceae bacterium]MDY5738542.1 biotin transporter BioY [Anaerovoracaceae bacterium]
MQNSKYFNMILCALFTALIAIGAFITIPAFPVPITLQCFFTILAAFLLPKYWGTVSAILYVAIGLMGFPIFTKGGGIGYVTQPSFGYLLGFILGNLICNYILEHIEHKSFKHYIFAGVVNLLVVYAIGVVYLAFILSSVYGTPQTASYLLVQGFAIFLPGNFVEVVIASIVALRVQKAIKI